MDAVVDKAMSSLVRAVTATIPSVKRSLCSASGVDLARAIAEMNKVMVSPGDTVSLQFFVACIIVCR